ncbi:MAG TPA: hypothetical protein VFZ17_13225 [Acidimicrobiia bacterium]|nr:hypothetical protein [Acidimicrobiia bacterium]
MDELGDGTLARVGAAARAEWRADEEEWSAAALEQWRHGRTLVDVAREHLHRGDVIAIDLLSPSPSLQGAVIGVATDLIAVDAFTGRVDVHVAHDAPIAWRIVERVADGGTRGLDLDGFRARLLELEAAATRVEVGVATSDAPQRGLLTVGRDHVGLEDRDASWVISLSALRWVRLAPSD